MPIHPFRTAAFVACLLVAPAPADVAPTPTDEAVVETVDVGAAPAGEAVRGTLDLSSIPRGTLERLAADLALENLLLTRGLTPAADHDTPDASVDAELPDDPERLDAAIAAVAERLRALRLHRASLAAAGNDAATDPSVEPVGAGAGAVGPPSPGGPGAADDDASDPARALETDAEVRGTTEGSAPYRYRYSFGLIGISGRGRVVVRGEDGLLRTEGYNFSEYRNDAVWVKLLFRNDGKREQRFTGAVALGHRAGGLGRARVRVLATVSLSTPVLQPGEIFETDREVKVDRVRDVDFVEVGRVRSFPPDE